MSICNKLWFPSALYSVFQNSETVLNMLNSNILKQTNIDHFYWRQQKLGNVKVKTLTWPDAQ